MAVSRGSVPDLRRVVDLTSDIHQQQQQQQQQPAVEHHHHRAPAAAGGAASRPPVMPQDVTVTAAASLHSDLQLDASTAAQSHYINNNNNNNNNGLHHHHQHEHELHQQQQQQQLRSRSTSVRLDDIFSISPHVPVSFEEIFVQPDALCSGDIGRYVSQPVRRVFAFIFAYTQEAVYYFLSIVLGLLFGVMWGCMFGLLDFMTVWLIQPAFTAYFVLLRAVSMPLRATLRCVFDPFFQSTAYALHYVSVRCTLHAPATHHSNDLHHQHQQHQQQPASVQLLGYV